MVITLLTDFGVGDTYVGMLKGAIYAIHRTAIIIDLTHAVEPQNVRQGAYLLRTAVSFFAPDSIHIAIVDPGVGTARRPILLQTAQSGLLIGPDNGLFDYVLAREAHAPQAWLLNKPAYWRAGGSATSATFHGCDIFAPIAAHLAHGVAPALLGATIDPASLVRLPTDTLFSSTHAALTHTSRVIAQGHVAHIDRFGNIQTDIEGALLTGLSEVERQVLHVRLDWQTNTGLHSITVQGLHATYGDVPPGAPLLLISSSDFVEVGVNGGNAAHMLGVPLGASAVVYLAETQLAIN